MPPRKVVTDRAPLHSTVVKKMLNSMVAGSKMGKTCYIPDCYRSMDEVTAITLDNVVQEAALPLSDPFWVAYWKEKESDRQDLPEVEVYHYSPALLGSIDTLVAEVSRDMRTSRTCTLAEVDLAIEWWKEPRRLQGFEEATKEMWSGGKCQ